MQTTQPLRRLIAVGYPCAVNYGVTTVQKGYWVAGVRLLGVTLVLSLGCQGEKRPEGMPELHPVTITLTQAGTPLADATVRLVPQDANNTWYSGGHTDEQGVAVIQTDRKYAGVPAGSYKVTVSKIEMPAPAAADLSPLDAPPGGATYDLVPSEYSHPDKTPLQLTVSAGENQQEFDLGAAVRIEKQGPPAP